MVKYLILCPKANLCCHRSCVLAWIGIELSIYHYFLSSQTRSSARHSLYIFLSSALFPLSSWVLLVCSLNLILSSLNFSSSEEISLTHLPSYSIALSWCIIIYHYLIAHVYHLPLPLESQHTKNEHFILFVAISPVHRTMDRTWHMVSAERIIVEILW